MSVYSGHRMNANARQTAAYIHINFVLVNRGNTFLAREKWCVSVEGVGGGVHNVLKPSARVEYVLRVNDWRAGVSEKKSPKQ